MAESKSLNEVLKSISKKYGDSVVKYGIDALDVEGTLSLGSPGLDFAIYGGIPEGRIVEFSGQEGSGKTTNSFLAAASYQKAEIQRNPDNPRAIVFLDNEGTADPVWAAKLGYDMREEAPVKTVCIRPDLSLIVLQLLYLHRLLMSLWKSSRWAELQRLLLGLLIQRLVF